MGGVISTGTDFVVDKLCSCFCLEVHHICRLDKNLETLEQVMDKLVARRKDVLTFVKREEDKGLKRLYVVDVWLTAVRNIETQFCETLVACTSELQGLSLCDGCSRKLVARFCFGKKVSSMLKDVKELTDRKLNEDISALALPPMGAVAGERDLQSIIVGQETLLENAWRRLVDEGTQVMGLHGMGGVGKTTLLEQINNKFCGENDGVDIVIWVVVSKVKRNEKIQDEIAEKLGLEGESWKQKTEVQKASSLRTCLKNKRFVLLLDDIWSKVELKDIGVPIPTRENKCKIVFTTRSREVCVRMGDTNPVEVSCLDTDKAWELFKEKVGEHILESHQGIPELAKKVAGKCRGLPLALNVLGETMSSQDTIQEWRHAVTTLTLSAAKFSGMDEILPVLKYSYDSLKEDMKPCFLYCSLFPEDFEISKEELIEYWICEGLLQEKQSREKAFDEGDSIISSLLRACLLSKASVYRTWLGVETNEEGVKMHDVVREMALWVASDLGEHEGRYTVQAGVGLQASVMLIYLDLEFTERLDNVSGISKFSRLRRLRLRHSGTKLDMSLLEELQLLKNLQVVTIGISSCLVAEKLSSYDRVVKCITELAYEDLEEESFRVLTIPTLVNLCSLAIEGCGMKEIKTEGGATSSCNKSPMSPSFLNLSKVFIFKCNGLKDLTWLLFAPNLKFLAVSLSMQIEYIISEEKATNGVTEKEAGTIIPFASLEYLSFYYVPMLKSIYWSSLPFPCLKRIRVTECPDLRKLPLDSKSVAKVEGFRIMSDRDWERDIEWEDEATKLRFQASCNNA